MISSIDCLTLVVAGALLVAFDRLTDANSRAGRYVLEACFWVGSFIFVVGTARAFIGAVGL